jgi:hypothetical protein
MPQLLAPSVTYYRSEGTMRVNILDSVSDPGSASALNEDALNYTAQSAWVLDGATGLGDEPLLPDASDAAWLTSAYDARLRARADCTRCELQDLFEGMIAEVGADFEARKLPRAPAGRFELPSAGMAFVRLRGAQLEYACLGDCRAILAPQGSALVFCTGSSRLQQLDANVLERMEDLRRGNASMSHEQIRALVRSDLRANRSLLNTEDDYWVLGTDPVAARHMTPKFVPLDGSAPLRGLLVSDGFYRLVDTFHRYDDAALLRAALERPLAGLLAELRALEDSDPECIRHPRLKPKDDATALLFEIVQAPQGGGAATAACDRG